MTIDWIDAPAGEAGGGLPTPTADAVLRGTGSIWEEAAALQVREDGVDIGSDDDDYHNVQGPLTIFGDYDDVLLNVVGHASIDRLAILDYITVAGGQYPAYYGYGIGGDQYPGFPYWGSYPAGAEGPQHGTGTTIDRRGFRTDERAVLERAFTYYDPVRGTWITVSPAWDGLNLTFDVAEDTHEPNAG